MFPQSNSTNQQVKTHSYSDGKSKDFVPEMDKWTNQYRGVFRIGAVDCEEYAALCTKEGVTEFPTFKIIPPVPIPIINFKVPTYLFRMN